MHILRTREELSAHNHKLEGYAFECVDCKEVKPLPVGDTCGTGYGYDNNRPLCYSCCGKRDERYMIREGRMTLYFTNPKRDLASSRHGSCKVTNWPGTLAFEGRYQEGRHNMAGRRYDVWFTGPDKTKWHGITYGDNTQICHCKRVKA